MNYYIDIVRFKGKLGVCYSRDDMNTYLKGNARERELMQVMEKQGFLVDRKNRSKYQSNDFFTMFDVVGIKGDRCVFVQVKSNRGDYLHACKVIQKWMRKNALSIEAQVWYRENRKEWQGSRVTRYSRVNISCF